MTTIQVKDLDACRGVIEADDVGTPRAVEVRFVYTHWVEVVPGEDPHVTARREIKEDGIDEIADYLVPLID